MSRGAVQAGQTSIPADREGRQKLFMSLIESCEPTLERVALRLCSGNHALAEDCLQEALISGLKAFLAGKVYDVQGFLPWMLRILTNRFLVENRYHKRVVASSKIESIIDSVNCSEDRNLETVSSDIQAALATLSIEHRVCIVMIDIQQFDYAQVAEILEIPIGTVRSRVSRARFQMARKLQSTYGGRS